MPSSIKMIKANKVYGGETTAKIETEIEVEEHLSDEIEDDNQVASEVKIAQKKSHSLIEQAKVEALQMKEQAEMEIKKMRKTTEEEAFKSGQEAGYQAGFTQGLTEGRKEADLQNEQMKASILQRIRDAEVGIKEYQADKKDELIQLASHMAEKIVHVHIDHAEEGVLELAKPFFYQLEKDEEFVTITTHPTQKKIVEEHLHQVEAISPHTRFMVFADPSLEEKGLVIESSKAVIDLQIKKQIDAMLQEFEEMERTVDA